MNNEEKTKDQLHEELRELRQRIAEIEASHPDMAVSKAAQAEGDQRLRVLFESAPDAYYLNDTKGRILDSNKAVEALTGYKRHELIGKTLLSSRFVPSNQISKMANILARNALGSPTGPDELTLIRKDGTQVFVELDTTPVNMQDQVEVLCIARDIRVRKQAEEILQGLREDLEERVTERTAALSEANELLTQEISARKQAEAALQVARKEQEAAIEERTAELLNANALLKQELSESKQTEEALEKARDDLEALLEERNGALSETNERLQEALSEQKRVQDALGEREAGYGPLLESMGEGYYEVDLNGNLTAFSDSFADILGYPRDELMGMNNRDYMDEENAKKAFQTFNGVFTKGEPAQAFDWQIIRKDGSVRSIELSVLLMKDAEERPIGFRGIVRDVTEKRKRDAQGLEARKMEAIGTLAGGIAHDFNNLLMGMQGNASLMLLDIDSTHPHYEKLRAIEQHVQSGADLTKQLLGFARGGKYDVRPTNMNDLVEKTSKAFGRNRKGLKIHRNYQEGIWTVEVDRDQIEQILSGLYTNAWQAMPDGGDLYLETENVVLEEKYYVEPYGVGPGKYVRISVTDTGVGMDEATKARVFEPFFTTKEMGRGTGLGLAAAYGIVRNHGGIINVYSDKGKGTTFNIYLPVSEGQ